MNIFRAVHAALGDEDDLRGHQRAQAAAHLHVDLKGPEIAVIDAHDPRSRLKRPFDFRLVVRLDQGREAELVSQLPVREQPRVVEDGDYQQHRRSAERPRGVDHVLVHGKILAQDRDRERRGYLAQATVLPFEPIGLGEAGDRRRARSLVIAGYIQVRKIPRDEPL
ncbi:hypothetical protein SDC9_136774 [bioreactor metagenome]|uniref:Uncharacterized protein n=1 Tax=bioreactor metagenome TaxID=1076179 RepID=A0A645DM85_9ZZZZ